MAVTNEQAELYRWKMCNLTYLATHGLASFVSLEAATREAAAFGVDQPTFMMYEGYFRNEIAMLFCICSDLCSICQAIKVTTHHLKWNVERPYRNVHLAANEIVARVRDIVYKLTGVPDSTQALTAINSQRVRTLDLQTEVMPMRRFQEHMTELYHGSVAKGIVGWKSLWDSVQNHG